MPSVELGERPDRAHEEWLTYVLAGSSGASACVRVPKWQLLGAAAIKRDVVSFIWVELRGIREANIQAVRQPGRSSPYLVFL